MSLPDHRATVVALLCPLILAACGPKDAPPPAAPGAGPAPAVPVGVVTLKAEAVTLERELPDLWARVERGDFAPILAFLRDRVHGKGHLDEAPAIIAAAVGERDHVEDLVSYLWARHGALYGAERR